MDGASLAWNSSKKKSHSQNLSLFDLSHSSRKKPHSPDIAITWPSLELCRKSPVPRAFVKNNQWQLFNISAAEETILKRKIRQYNIRGFEEL